MAPAIPGVGKARDEIEREGGRAPGKTACRGLPGLTIKKPFLALLNVAVEAVMPIHHFSTAMAKSHGHRAMAAAVAAAAPRERPMQNAKSLSIRRR